LSDKLSKLLKELESFGDQNDASTVDRSQKMRNITPDTGEFLLLLIRALRAKRILEIGTSNGYSTLWLAYAVQSLGGKVATLEKSSSKVDMARINFKRSGLQDLIDLKVIDAGAFLKQQLDASFDFVFLDANRGEYVSLWQDLQRVLTGGGLLVVDNAVSHAREMEDFVRVVRQTKGYLTSLVPVGKGELVILKETSLK
jgi:predicted O-methyltransferase YrrM